MSRIVKPPAPGEIPPSVSTQLTHVTDLANRREAVHSILKRFDEAQTWDAIQARDVPSELIDYVAGELRRGVRPDDLRRSMGILRATDKSWKKIMSALRGGLRVDGSAFLQQKAYEFEAISSHLKDQIMEAFTKGVPVMDPNGDIQHVVGPSKELAGTIDAYSRLQQSFVKLGKDLGAFVEGGDNKGGSGGGGVTIVVKNNVPFPTTTEITSHQEKMGKTQTLVVEGRNAEEP